MFQLSTVTQHVVFTNHHLRLLENMRASILLFVVCLSQFATADFIAAADSRIYHTKWNWYVNTSIGSIEAANCGPYVKFTITNTTQVICERWSIL